MQEQEEFPPTASVPSLGLSNKAGEGGMEGGGREGGGEDWSLRKGNEVTCIAYYLAVVLAPWQHGNLPQAPTQCLGVHGDLECDKVYFSVGQCHPTSLKYTKVYKHDHV